MIDLHTHILPDMDDGAANAQVSATLLQMEAEQGVTKVVFTPHYYGKRSVENFLEKRQAATETIRSSIPENVRVYAGAEVLMTGVNDPSDDALCQLAIEGTKYVLFELPFQRWRESLLDRIADFIEETGYTPIIAHVERYVEVLKNPSVLTYLAELGCLIQVNTSAFLDKRLKRFAFALLKKGMVHCIGTDAHNAETRTVDYAQAKNLIYKKGLEAEWNSIQWCMQKVLNGENVLLPCQTLKKFGIWYF